MSGRTRFSTFSPLIFRRISPVLLALIVPSLAELSFEFGSDIVYVPSQLNSVFPAQDFNRNVTTTFWETTILSNGASIQEDLERFKNISFIAYDKSFYEVSHLILTSE